jgi:putative membrane protein
MGDNDPRVFFAAERTLLAWVRTGLGLIGMGFVVARFGLFLRVVRPTVSQNDHLWTEPVGVGLAVLGALAAAQSAWQHRRFCRTLGPNELPRNYRVQPGYLLGFGVALAGLILAAALLG